MDGPLVRRPAQTWTATVHALLRHLRARGLECVPRPLGIEDGVETVSFLPGASGADCWPLQATDAGLRSAARLLRTVHDASRGWTPPPGARWGGVAEVDAEVVCHGDPGPWNMVWDGPEAVGLIDWDFAHPGRAIDDVAYALEYFTPFRSDEDAVRWHGFGAAPDRPARLRMFIEAYGIGAGGLDSADGLVDAVLARQERTLALVAALARDGAQPQRQWVEEGYLDTLRARVRWTRHHRHLIE